MGNIILDMAISLDGYIGGADGEDVGLYDWYFAPSAESQTVIDELIATLGAIVMGKRAFGTGEESDGGFGDSPYNATYFVLTHTVPEGAKDTPGFVFVTDGIESALQQAKAAAGERDVAIGGGANVAQQYLNAGLVDEIQLHIVSVVLGKGLRLFDNLEMAQMSLERTRVVEGTGVTHVKYRVVK